jgi:non-heme chloroperoxidase
MARHGRDIGELLEHLGLNDATLVGVSMGGNAIWAYIDQFGTDRVRAIVIVDQTPKMLNSPDWPYGFYGYQPSNAGTFFANGIRPTGRGRDQAKSGPGLARLTERLGGPPGFRDPAAPETIKLLNDHALQDWRDVVERVERPVLMIAGRESQLWPCEHAQAAIASNPFGRAVIIEDSGHTISSTSSTGSTTCCLTSCATRVWPGIRNSGWLNRDHDTCLAELAGVNLPGWYLLRSLLCRDVPWHR